MKNEQKAIYYVAFYLVPRSIGGGYSKHRYFR